MKINQSINISIKTLLLLSFVFSLFFESVFAQANDLSIYENLALYDLFSDPAGSTSYYESHNRVAVKESIKELYLNNKENIKNNIEEKFGSFDSEEMIKLYNIKFRLYNYVVSDRENKKYVKEAIAVLMGIHEFESTNSIFTSADSIFSPFDSSYIYRFDRNNSSMLHIDKATGKSSSVGTFEELSCVYLSNIVSHYTGVGIMFTSRNPLFSGETGRYSREEYLNKEKKPGIVVLEVKDKSPAESSGIKRGDIIIEINGVSGLENITLGEISELLQGDSGKRVSITLDTGKVHDIKTGKVYNNLTYNHNFDKVYNNFIYTYDKAIDLIKEEDIYQKIVSHKQEVFDFYESEGSGKIIELEGGNFKLDKGGDTGTFDFSVGSFICLGQNDVIYVFYDDIGFTQEFDLNGNKIYSKGWDYSRERFHSITPLYINDDTIIFESTRRYQSVYNQNLDFYTR